MFYAHGMTNMVPGTVCVKINFHGGHSVKPHLFDASQWIFSKSPRFWCWHIVNPHPFNTLQWIFSKYPRLRQIHFRRYFSSTNLQSLPQTHFITEYAAMAIRVAAQTTRDRLTDMDVIWRYKHPIYPTQTALSSSLGFLMATRLPKQIPCSSSYFQQEHINRESRFPTSPTHHSALISL